MIRQNPKHPGQDTRKPWGRKSNPDRDRRSKVHRP